MRLLFNSFRKPTTFFRPNSSSLVRVLRNVALASALGGLITLGASAAPAFGASSGWVFGTTHASVTYCNEATINTGRVADGYIESNSGSSCGQNHNSPAGYLNVQVVEFFNGSVCGTAGYDQNDVPASLFGLGGAICGDQGHGTYSTQTNNAYWNSGAGQYYGAGYADSPGQTYNVVQTFAGTTLTSSGESEGPVSESAFVGRSLVPSLLPDYISVTSAGEIVGYVQTVLLMPAVGEPVQNPAAPFPVYNAALSLVVGQLESGRGFVPFVGSGLPATLSNGNAISITETSLVAPS
jgi:hypothetical protein